VRSDAISVPWSRKRPDEGTAECRVRSPTMPDPMLSDDRLTATGLLIEAHAGVRDVVEAELDTFGLTGSAFEIMIRLARSPGQRLRMTELAAQSTLTSSGLTRLVDRLQASGLVDREPCDTDRRGYFAVLTPEGDAKVLDVLPSHLVTVDRVLTGVLEPDELATFLVALRKIRAVVRPSSDPAVAAQVADDAEAPVSS